MRYVAILGLALAGLAVYLVVSSSSTSRRPLTDRQLHAMELAALGRLPLPGGFVPVRQGCLTGRCFVGDGASTQVAQRMPGLLRAAGVEPPGALRSAEPIALLKQAHWTTTSKDPLVLACRSVRTSSGRALTECQDAGRFGQTLVNVLIEPYQRCPRPRCTQAGRTEILVWAAAFAKAG